MITGNVSIVQTS